LGNVIYLDLMNSENHHKNKNLKKTSNIHVPPEFDQIDLSGLKDINKYHIKTKKAKN